MATGVYREASTPKSKGKKLDHLRITKGAEGGHVVEHHFAEDGMVYHKPVSHVFGDGEGQEMLHHVAKHMGVTGPSRETPEEPEGPEEES
jgi:hypothetical protein